MNDVTSQTATLVRRVAVPTDGSDGLTARRSGHFGHCSHFTIVELNGIEIGEVKVIENAPHQEGGCMTPVMLLADTMVDAIVVDGIGGRPLAGFTQMGIAVHAGVGETVEHVVRAYAMDLLPQVGPGGTCQH
jgi:predicted Fe-Mo cluster-binding NifX family protein